MTGAYLTYRTAAARHERQPNKRNPWRDAWMRWPPSFGNIEATIIRTNMAVQASVSTLLLRTCRCSPFCEHQLALLTGVVMRRTFPRTTIMAAGDATTRCTW